MPSFRGAKEIRESLGSLNGLHDFSVPSLHAGLCAYTAEAMIGLALIARGCNVVARGVLVLFIHSEREGGHAMRGEHFFARARGGSRAEKSCRRCGPKGSGTRPASGKVARRRRSRGKKGREAGGAIKRGLLHLGEKGELSEGLEREIAVTRGLGKTSEGVTKRGKGGR